MKTVDTQEYVSTLRALAEEGHEVSMLIAGSSMTPFLCHLRDRIFFAVPDRPLRRGDMVFYQRASGQYVCHASDLQGQKRRLLHCRRCADAGGGPCCPGADLCPHHPGGTKGQVHFRGRFLVGFFCRPLADSAACTSHSRTRVRLVPRTISQIITYHTSILPCCGSDRGIFLCGAFHRTMVY